MKYQDIPLPFQQLMISHALPERRLPPHLGGTFLRPSQKDFSHPVPKRHLLPPRNGRLSSPPKSASHIFLKGLLSSSSGGRIPPLPIQRIDVLPNFQKKSLFSYYKAVRKEHGQKHSQPPRSPCFKTRPDQTRPSIRLERVADPELVAESDVV